MKFLWNVPNQKDSNDLGWKNVLIGWLNYNGIWSHTDDNHWACEYDYINNSFEISIYECWLPGNGKSDEHIHNMRKYLQNSDLNWKESSIFIMDNEKQRPGIQFIIYATDHSKPMQLILNTPIKELSCIGWEIALIGWLNYNSIFPRNDHQHLRIEYNDFHHFFNIIIYECWLIESDTVIQDMFNYLKKSNLEWESSPTFIWDKGQQRSGMRFFIRAEDHPRAN